MKKTFEIPEIEILPLEVEDIILFSEDEWEGGENELPPF